MSGQWRRIDDNLVEHRNGNWVWKVGEKHEVWLRIRGTLMFAGIADTKETALKIASENMLEVLKSGVGFQTLDRWLEKHESR